MDNKFNNMLQEFLEKNNVKDINEANEKLQEFIKMYNNGEIEYKNTPFDEAYEILEEAQYTNIVVNRPSFEPVPTISTTLGNGVINTGVKHNYVLTFKFNENGENQDEFQGKTFKANVVAKGE